MPAKLARFLKTFDVNLADELGWAEVRNGTLLEAAEESGFDVLLTADETIQAENELAGRRIGLVAMSDNHWRIVRDHVPAIAEALHKCKPDRYCPFSAGTLLDQEQPRRWSLDFTSNALARGSCSAA